jgi:hypothetical protein
MRFSRKAIDRQRFERMRGLASLHGHVRSRNRIALHRFTLFARSLVGCSYVFPFTRGIHLICSV